MGRSVIFAILAGNQQLKSSDTGNGDLLRNDHPTWKAIEHLEGRDMHEPSELQ
jgi:hypothetical protein